MPPESAVAALEQAAAELTGVAELGAGQERRIRELIEQLRAQVHALGLQRGGGVSGTAQAAPLTLLALPADVLVRIISFLEAPSDFARLTRVCWQLRGAPPPRILSPVEGAVRERAARRGLALPTALVPEARSWTEALLRAECERLAICRCSPLAAAAFHTASISARQHLVTFGCIAIDDALESLEPAADGSDFPDMDGLLGTGRLSGGLDEGDIVEPTLVGGIANVLVRSVAAGHLHSLVVSARGRVYSFGCGARGRLGHADGRSKLAPKLVQALEHERVVGAAAGSAHSLFLTADGRVFACGEALRAGLADFRPRTGAAEPDGGARAAEEGAQAGEEGAQAVEEGAQAGEEGAQAAEEGAPPSPELARAPAAADDSEVTNLQAALCACRCLPEPEPVGALGGLRIVSVASRDAHSLALDDAGRVFSWGSANRHGELGRTPVDERRARPQPGTAPVSSTAAAAALACHAAASAVYAAASAQYAELVALSHPTSQAALARELWERDLALEGSRTPPAPGSAPAAQPVRSTRDLPFRARGFFLPRRVDGLLGEHIESVSAGVAFSAAVSSSGRLFTWGAGSEGQLGHGDLLDRAEPTAVRGELAGVPVVLASAGFYGCLALSAERHVYAWGNAGALDEEAGEFRSPCWLCGHGARRGCREPKRVERLRALLDAANARQPSGARAEPEERIAWISAGRAASFAAGTKGSAFGWGSLDFCGLPEMPSHPSSLPEQPPGSEIDPRALRTNRMHEDEETFVIMPERFAERTLALPPMDAMLRLLEAPAVQPPQRSLPKAARGGDLCISSRRGRAAAAGGSSGTNNIN